MRSSFAQIEQKAKNLSRCGTYHRETHRQHLPSRFNGDASDYGSAGTQIKPLTPSEKFKHHAFLLSLTTYYLLCLTVKKPVKN